MTGHDELEAELRELFTPVDWWDDSDDVCPFCHCACANRVEDRVKQAMALFDQYATATRRVDTENFWTARRAAEFLGLKNPAAARSTFSREGIEAAIIADGKALYPANEIRALHEKRTQSR